MSTRLNDHRAPTCGTEAVHAGRHTFGQPGKKEYGIDNVKVSNSAWDTNLIAASGVSFYSTSFHRAFLQLLSSSPYLSTF